MGHLQGLTIVLVLLELRPIGFMFSLISFVIVPFILFSFGNKYIVSKTVNKLVSDKAEVLLFPIIDKILNKVKSDQPELFRQGADRNKLKLKMIQEIIESTENRWLKKTISYGLRKVSLNDIDFKDESLSLPDILKSKIISRLQNMSKPSRIFFWIILLFELTIFILIIVKVI